MIFYALSRTFCFVLQIHPPNLPNAVRQIRTIFAAILCTFFGEFLQNSFPIGGPFLVVVYRVSPFPIGEFQVAFPVFFRSNRERSKQPCLVLAVFLFINHSFSVHSPARLQKTRRGAAGKAAHIAAHRSHPRGKSGSPDRKTPPVPVGKYRRAGTPLGLAQPARRRRPAPERNGSPG